MIITPDLSNVSLERLLKRYGDGKRRARMEPIYRSVLSETVRISEPAAVYDEFQLGDLPELWPWLPLETTAVVCGLCTLGPDLQRHINEVSQTDIVSAVVFDEITLACVTAVTRQIHGLVRSEAQERGLKAGAAYRPGLGRWPIETQRTVFGRIPAHRIGVTLNEQLVMMPKQSTSMIIPILDRNR